MSTRTSTLVSGTVPIRTDTCSGRDALSSEKGRAGANGKSAESGDSLGVEWSEMRDVTFPHRITRLTGCAVFERRIVVRLHSVLVSTAYRSVGGGRNTYRRSSAPSPTVV